MLIFSIGFYFKEKLYGSPLEGVRLKKKTMVKLKKTTKSCSAVSRRRKFVLHIRSLLKKKRPTLMINTQKTPVLALKILKILKVLGYNLGGFTLVIIIWATVFFIMRLPWKFLINRKRGLVYSSLYLLIVVVLVEEYSYWPLLTESDK